jgi:hypothetical protein
MMPRESLVNDFKSIREHMQKPAVAKEFTDRIDDPAFDYGDEAFRRFTLSIGGCQRKDGLPSDYCYYTVSHDCVKSGRCEKKGESK